MIITAPIADAAQTRQQHFIMHENCGLKRLSAVLVSVLTTAVAFSTPRCWWLRPKYASSHPENHLYYYGKMGSRNYISSLVIAGLFVVSVAQNAADIVIVITHRSRRLCLSL